MAIRLSQVFGGSAQSWITRAGTLRPGGDSRRTDSALTAGCGVSLAMIFPGLRNGLGLDKRRFMHYVCIMVQVSKRGRNEADRKSDSSGLAQLLSPASSRLSPIPSAFPCLCALRKIEARVSVRQMADGESGVDFRWFRAISRSCARRASSNALSAAKSFVAPSSERRSEGSARSCRCT